MKIRFLLFLGLCLIPLSSIAETEAEKAEQEFKDWYAAENQKPWQERMGFEFTAKGRLRHEGQDSGDDVFRVQPRIEVKGYVDLTVDGCLKAKTKAGTGSKFSTGWDDFKTSTRDENLNFNVREIYFDYELCDIANAHIEFGGLNAKNPHEIGAMGPKSTGYFEGARIRYTTPDGETKWVVAVGNMDEFDEPNFFDRDYGETNYKELSVTHSLNEKVALMANIIEHAENVYVRAAVKIKLSHITGLVDEVNLENSWVEGEQQGAIVRLKKKMGHWGFELSGSHIEDFQGFGERIPTEDFFGLGKDGKARTNGQFKVSFGISKNCSIPFGVRAGQSPTRAETGFSCKF